MSESHVRTGSSWIAPMVGATVVAWAGFLVHNIADLPGQTPLSPESLFPTVVTVGLLAFWLVPATRRAGAWALLAWSALNLVVGGILSVLPMGLFPFDPVQSWRHYAFHGVYAATQVPLAWISGAWLRRSFERGSPG